MLDGVAVVVGGTGVAVGDDGGIRGVGVVCGGGVSGVGVGVGTVSKTPLSGFISILVRPCLYAGLQQSDTSPV